MPLLVVMDTVITNRTCFYFEATITMANVVAIGFCLTIFAVYLSLYVYA